jgi:hypothetical protein
VDQERIVKPIKRNPVIQAPETTALLVGGVTWQLRQPHTSFECVLLYLNSDFVTYENISVEPSDYDEIPLCKILYFVRGTGLLAE